MKFRRKPTVIEAVQFTGHNFGEILDWAAEHGGDIEPIGLSMGITPSLRVHTLEGEMEASASDWIIKGTHGEFYPVKPHIFDANYEAVSE